MSNQMEDRALKALVEELRAAKELPLCPYDRRSPDYWTTNDTAPCKVCGQLNDQAAPILCRGADMSILTQAATALEGLAGENSELRLAICGGEDAPGYADSLPLEAILKVHRDNMQSWKRDSELAWDGETANSWKARALSAEAALSEVRGVLEPFAKTAAVLGDTKDSAIWAGQKPAPPLTFGDFRRAARAFEALSSLRGGGFGKGAAQSQPVTDHASASEAATSAPSLLDQARALEPAEQRRLAEQIAANVGYELVEEGSHADYDPTTFSLSALAEVATKAIYTHGFGFREVVGPAARGNKVSVNFCWDDDTLVRATFWIAPGEEPLPKQPASEGGEG